LLSRGLPRTPPTLELSISTTWAATSADSRAHLSERSLEPEANPEDNNHYSMKLISCLGLVYYDDEAGFRMSVNKDLKS
jgi:hypothetical protein